MMKHKCCREMFPTTNVPNGGRTIHHVDTFNGKTAMHRGKKVQVVLEARVKLWPMPKSSAAGPDFAKMDRSATGISLQTAVAMLPMPTAMDYKAGATDTIGHQSLAAEINRQKAEPTPGSGSLNPDWVELLMGWPLGWTDVSLECEAEFRGWGEGWEDGVPRVTTKSQNRVNRLKCIGNGQVPQAAALAWEILTGGRDEAR